MAVFPLLADPQGYRACDTDLLVDDDARAYWLELFSTHFEVLLDAAGTVGVGEAARAAARADFGEIIGDLRGAPDRHGRLDILVLDELRHAALRRHGIRDEFRIVKARENDLAMSLLERRLRGLDATAAGERLEAMVRGMLAGNLFDMGVTSTAGRFSSGPVPFEEAMAGVPVRPWLVDDLDEAGQRWAGRPARRAVIFADNAGADLVLGLLPLARELLSRGTEVVIAANAEPTLNDVTAEEVAELLRRAADIDAAFASPSLSVVSSGSAAPLIDLTRVSDELASAAEGADMVVLVGMGRSIESNLSARLRCETWKIAMVKDPQVARSIGGALYDAVFRREGEDPALQSPDRHG